MKREVVYKKCVQKAGVYISLKQKEKKKKSVFSSCLHGYMKNKKELHQQETEI